jgi:Uncharacterized membrane protein
MNMHFIGQSEIDFIVNLVFCLFSGLLIGGEREWRLKDAGISTHVLVITGAMVFTFLSSQVDPASKSRIAAQVVSGIGFLGAGLILKDGTSVKNLTTAASLWVSASIGMAYGFGFHVVGLLATIVTALAPRLPHMKRWRRKPKDGGE